MISKKAMFKGAIGALALSTSLFSMQAYAWIDYGYDIEYYSDASMTDMVGETIMTCENKVATFGVKTAYAREVSRWSCDTGFPEEPPQWV
jgi:hypothetical protein